MSRIPQSPARTTQSRTALVPPTSRSRATSPSKLSQSTTSSRVPTKSAPSSPRKPARKPLADMEPPMPKPALNIKEAIALKRAEAKKAEAANSSKLGQDLGEFEGLEEASPIKQEEESLDVLGRMSIREAIERARSTGSINVTARSIPCLPSALFEIHLGITPQPLKSVTSEPPIGTSPEVPTRRGGHPSWFEAQDLVIIKAFNNDIIEIQPEISLFGSLKTLDLHKNKIMSLPESLADLGALSILDVSENSLTTLPPKLFSLPSLVNLNVAHNELIALPFNAPFSSSDGRPKPRSSGAGSFFVPLATYADSPLPKLVILDASYNKIQSHAIDHTQSHIPRILSKLNLSGNPLGDCRSLIRSLSTIETLKELRMNKADINDASLPLDLFMNQSASEPPFPGLTLLDVGETRVTVAAAEACFGGKLKQKLNFDWSTEEPPPSVLRVLVGKKVVKEPWELETERRAKLRTAKATPYEDDAIFSGMGKGSGSGSHSSQPVPKEAWEIEAEQGLLTEGGRRRARAAAATAAAVIADPEPRKSSASVPNDLKQEAWEIEAEQGLLTAGGRRRARAAAAAAAATEATGTASTAFRDIVPTLSRKSSSISGALANPQYYSQKMATLTLPSLAPTPKGHARAFSHSAWPASGAPGNVGDVTLPTPTLPLAAISSQSYANTLRVLILKGRRLDVSLTIPSETDLGGMGLNLLPALEELSLEGCGVKDIIPVSRASMASTDLQGQQEQMNLLPLIINLFPRLQTLDLSDNALTDVSFTGDVLSSLILATAAADQVPARPGLRHLRVRGNRLVELEGFQELAEMFKGNRALDPDWKLEELDLRDNEVGKLPPELGLLPLDVFLVDGNVFRVPQRRVWEREGSKGLLSWLRGRIE